jgi:hypothetical protein
MKPPTNRLRKKETAGDITMAKRVQFPPVHHKFFKFQPLISYAGDRDGSGSENSR